METTTYSIISKVINGKTVYLIIRKTVWTNTFLFIPYVSATRVAVMDKEHYYSWTTVENILKYCLIESKEEAEARLADLNTLKSIENIISN